MGELNLLDVISSIRDQVQRHKAKTYFGSPEYQDASGAFQLSGEYPGSTLAKSSTNPYIANALHEAVNAKLQSLAGGLTKAQTSNTYANAQGTAGNEARTQFQFMRGGQTPEFQNAGTAEKATNFTIDQANRERPFYEAGGFGPTANTARTTVEAQQGKNQGRAIDVQQEHGRDANSIEALKSIFGTMDFTNMKNNFPDLVSAFSGSPGMLGETMKALNNIRNQRTAGQKAELAKLTGGGGGDVTAPTTSPTVENPYQTPVVRDASMKMQQNLGTQRPEGTSWIDKILGGFSGFSPSAGANTGLKETTNVGDMVKTMNDTATQIRQQLANLQKLDKTSSAGYNKYNSAVQSIQKLSQPLMQVYPHLQKMGYNPPPDLQALMQELMQLQRPQAGANSPLDLNLKTQ